MPLGVSDEQKALQERQLAQFKQIFGLELKHLPDPEERFFMTEFLRQRMCVLCNTANGVAGDMAALFTSTPSESLKGVEESLQRLAEMRETASRKWYDLAHARDTLVELGFDVDDWGLSISAPPTIGKRATTPTP